MYGFENNCISLRSTIIDRTGILHSSRWFFLEINLTDTSWSVLAFSYATILFFVNSPGYRVKDEIQIFQINGFQLGSGKKAAETENTNLCITYLPIVH